MSRIKLPKPRDRTGWDRGYKGYSIRHSSTGEIFIEKDGAFIGWVKSIEDAQKTIDMLTANPRRKNPGLGSKFLFFGKFKSKILAARAERSHPGSFMIPRKGFWYVLKEKKTVAKKNPSRGTVIYGRVLKIYAQKTSGPYKGQRFVHTFKAGAVMLGRPDGSLVIKHS